jgi:hypothetical protein
MSTGGDTRFKYSLTLTNDVMTQDVGTPKPEHDPEDTQPELLEALHAILEKVAVEKIYFIDDAVDLPTDKATFIGLVRAVVRDGNIEQLRQIKIEKAIDFTIEEEVLEDHIDKVWDTIKPGKQINYFRQIYAIAGEPEAINDLNVTNRLKEFFPSDIFEALSPTQWDERRDSLLAGIGDNKRILVLFDQDLKLGKGRFTDNHIRGEDLIHELLALPNQERVIKALFTHTVPSSDLELPERRDIASRIPALTVEVFFVLTKARLDKSHLFADGIKKTCLNTFCEDIKTKTIDILTEAQRRTIERVRAFDTYDFDVTVFKSSIEEGVWEPETLLRITDIIFRDEVRRLMIDQDYVPQVNQSILDAADVSKINFKLDDTSSVYSEKIKLRHQELYEQEALLNVLRRPIDNGDIFTVTEGEQMGTKFILIAQPCDLMVRGGEKDKGKRGARVANLLPIEVFTHEGLLGDLRRKYSSDISNNRYLTHYYADKFKLEYFESGTTKVGIVHLSKAIAVDINVLDLIVFNEVGEAVFDLEDSDFNAVYHNYAWRNRHAIISEEFRAQAAKLDALYAGIATIGDADLESHLQEKVNRLLAFIFTAGVQVNYRKNKFVFGLKRISRLRMPKSKYLLDRHYQYLGREAEPHDFAWEKTNPIDSPSSKK